MAIINASGTTGFTFNVPGTTGFKVPQPAKLVNVAGEAAWLVIENGNARIWAKLGAAAGTVRASSKYRRAGAVVSEKIVGNRRDTAAALLLTLAPGQSFEACGYSRTAQWKRYTFNGETLVCEAL